MRLTSHCYLLVCIVPTPSFPPLSPSVWSELHRLTAHAIQLCEGDDSGETDHTLTNDDHASAPTSSFSSASHSAPPQPPPDYASALSSLRACLVLFPTYP